MRVQVLKRTNGQRVGKLAYDPAKAKDDRKGGKRGSRFQAEHGEWLGASLALTPVPDRCAHWGDRKTCTQCLAAQIETEDAERREQRRRAA